MIKWIKGLWKCEEKTKNIPDEYISYIHECEAHTAEFCIVEPPDIYECHCGPIPKEKFKKILNKKHSYWTRGEVEDE